MVQDVFELQVCFLCAPSLTHRKEVIAHFPSLAQPQ